MTPYTYAGDNPETGMSSFTWQEPGAPAKTYRVVWTWRHTRRVSAYGMNREDADFLCRQLNELAAQYQQDDEYTVEEECPSPIAPACPTCPKTGRL